MAGIVPILVGTLAFFCVNVSGLREWCNLKCRDPWDGTLHQNTMCEYEEKTSTARCKSIRNSMTAERRADLLKQHNEFRNKVAGGNLKGWPAAADMRLLTWDDDLEKTAQRWASQCTGNHDVCRRNPNFKRVGQNFLSWGTSASFTTKPITKWIREGYHASTDLIDSWHNDGVTSHFSQMIWASTYKLGCGEITFKKRGERGWTFAMLYCNYGPAGNFKNHRMYTKGEPCTSCPDGTQCFPDSEYPYLCATEEEISSLSE